MRCCGKPSCKSRARRNALTADAIEVSEQELWTNPGEATGFKHRHQRNLIPATPSAAGPSLGTS